MKKVITLLMTIVLIASIHVSVCADGLSTAQRVSQALAEQKRENEPTVTRSLSELLQLCVKRMEQFEELTKMDCNYFIQEDTIKAGKQSGLLECSFAFGTAFVNKSDYTVESVLMLLVDGDCTEEETQANLYKCVSVMSALEYSDLEDAVMNITGKLDPKSSSSAIAKTYQLFGDRIIANTLNLLEQPTYNLGDEVKVYTGNYDYYASGENIDGSELIFLIAKKR